MNLTHAWLRSSQSRPPGEADLADPGLPKLQCLFDRADHDDLRCPIREGNGSRGESTGCTHRGRIVKTTGDGLLVEFSSVVDALRCATEWQNGMVELNAALPDDNRIAFRIGVHQGDIVVENDDIFGDGVNVAARLEALAEPEKKAPVRGLARIAFPAKLIRF
jgi:hypothetical protein